MCFRDRMRWGKRWWVKEDGSNLCTFFSYLFLWSIAKELLSLKIRRCDLDLHNKKESSLTPFWLWSEENSTLVPAALSAAGFAAAPSVSGQPQGLLSGICDKNRCRDRAVCCLNHILADPGIHSSVLKAARASWSLPLLLCPSCSAVTDTEADDLFMR